MVKTDNAPILELRDVTFKYAAQKEPTLKKLNLKIRSGELVVIAGASGSGKSTLGRLISGLIPEAYPGDLTGDLLINGQVVNGQSIFERSQAVGTVLQDTNAQFVGLSVAEDVAFALENDGVATDPMHVAVLEWLERLDLGQRMNLAPQFLSGGQKQRTAMAGVLIDESPVLLLDEPLASLDQQSGSDMLDLLDRLREERGLTIILIEHRLTQVLQHNLDQLVILDAGEIQSNTEALTAVQTNCLPAYGLAEPLYIRLLKRAGIDLDETQQLLLPEQVTAPHLAEKLASTITDFPTLPTDNFWEPILTVEHLSYGYGPAEPLFKDVNFHLDAGEIVALVGKNGSGKSTLINILTGFITDKKMTGRLRLHNQDLSKLSIKERADVIGYVIQDPNLMLTQSSVYDEVALGLRLRGYEEADIEVTVTDLLKTAGLYPMRNWPIDSLSFGQKKRLSIIAILALRPEILILDEPTAGQDAYHAQKLIAFILKLKREYELTILVVTHDMGLMCTIADRSVVLVDGEIIANGTPAAILADQDVVTAGNLQATTVHTLLQRFDLVADTKVFRALTGQEAHNES